MHRIEKQVHSKSFAIMAIILLLFSIFSSSYPVGTLSADATNSNGIQEGYGQIKNGEGEIDYEEAKINKEVSFGNNPGEFFIDLTVKGKDYNAGMKTDIVIPYDLSNSMENNKVPGTNKTRTEVAAEATKDFINGLLGSGNNYRIAFVPYGTSIMDGKTRSQLQRTANQNGGNYSVISSVNPYNYYVGNFTSNASEITSKIPSTINHGNHGGTFTQQALERAGQIMSTSNADCKIIVTITDGLPTVSYNQNRAPWGTGAENQGDSNMRAHRSNTIAEANSLKKDYTLFSIGVGLSSSSIAEREVIEGIADGSDKAYYADSVQDLVATLKDISSQIKSDTVANGSITDPITDEFILPESSFGQAGSDQLEDGEYFLSASYPGLLEGVTVKAENQHILVDGLNLGENEWVKVRYKVQIDTENPDLVPSKLYKTNGTTLTPNGDDPEDPPTNPEDPGYPPVSPPDEVEVPVDPVASIELIKEADNKEVSKVNETITYTFTVTNTGKITLEDVYVFDETFNKAVELENTTLEPGETTTGTLAYVVSQEDLDNGEIINIAITEGTPTNYKPRRSKQ